MNLWIELDQRLPYALTLPQPRWAEEADNAYLILDYFNAYCYNGDEEAGEKEFTLIPEPKEVENWSLAFKMAAPISMQVKVKEINSILAIKR